MWLAIDTATDRASVAIGFPDAVRAEETLLGARRHAAAILPLIQRAVQRGGGNLAEIEGVAVADGPGSFTGLRVGASVAKALAHARGLPVWTAPSLLTLAAGSVRGAEASILAVSDALRGQLFAACYRFRPARIDTILAPVVATPGELTAMVPKPDVIVGTAGVEAMKVLSSWAGTGSVDPEALYPKASILLGLVGRAGGARRVEELGGWEPDYGRPAEAQARWEKAHGRRLPDSTGTPG